MKEQRQRFKSEIPTDIYGQLKELNKANRWFDGLTIAGVFLLFLLLLAASPFLIHHLWLYIPYLFIQGFVIHCIAQLWHDYGTHDQFIMPKLRYVIAFLLPFSPTQYKHNHYAHHRAMPNSDEDPDKIYNDPRGRLRKLIAFTCFQTISAVLMSKDKRGNQLETDQQSRIRFELPCFYILVCVAIILTILGLPILLLGWLLPTIIGASFWNGLRVFAEHSETDKTKLSGTGNFIMLPAWMQCLPYCTLFGEGHIIHHYFPRMPWYHCAKAAKLIRPYLKKESMAQPFFKTLWHWLNA